MTGSRWLKLIVVLAAAFVISSGMGVAQVKTPSKRQVDDSSGPMSANSTFGLIRGYVSSAAIDKNTWESFLRDAKLTPWRDQMWHLDAEDGEVRATAFFRNDESSFWVLYFPSQPAPMSDATLAWMYRTSSSYSFDDGDGVELQFDGTLKDVKGSRSQTFSISLSSGRLVRTSSFIKWKH
jgi:hypothetical protein